jgi:predicted transcriptional regulator of viral defense system
LVPALFAPAYVGGRTAAEHWDLTEQIFNDIVVMTTRTVRQKTQQLHGTIFTIKHIDDRAFFGTKTLWRGRTKVMVSDLHRTVVDMLDDPAVAGGIQQVSDCLSEYFKRGDRNDQLLLEHADRLGNGAVFKRLGFLAERNGGQNALAHACRARLTKGKIKLDPSLDCPTLITRWRLWVPARWKQAPQ